MAKVLGLGGVFFKAEDPAAVRAWYARVLGFEVQDWGGVMFKSLKTGFANWSPFAADTRYFEPSQAPAEGVEPTGRQDEDMGKFAWLIDPAGVKIELWEPSRPSLEA
jgi:catechol 2,3-dioxygenase-like lactoylglutathione lyase family enzyme